MRIPGVNRCEKADINGLIKEQMSAAARIMTVDSSGKL